MSEQYPQSGQPSHGGPGPARKTWHTTTAGVLTIVFGALGALAGLLVAIGAADAEITLGDTTYDNVDNVAYFAVVGGALAVTGLIGVVGGSLLLRGSSAGRGLTYLAAAVSIPLAALMLFILAVVPIGIAIWVIVLISLRPVRDYLNAR